ncbi:MAG: DNA polymerase III subunit delta' [Chlamydiales bacterium]|nr:DNA polymerase III subunit delta' [Chlamydiia bacterium]MCP5507296.1 DNA polymerase III subunit delta' [Chlamydiales bacterium]
MFSHLIGNDQIKEYLQRMVKKQAVSNSLLFSGPEGIGKSLYAQAFAKLLICQEDPHGSHAHKIDSGNHPDIYHYRPEGKIGMHSIEAMRRFSEEVYMAPYEAKWKVFIIHDAHRMLTYSANALLKTFEEPASFSVIILLSHSPEHLLPTVLSRCRAVHFHAVSTSTIADHLIRKQGIDKDTAFKYAGLAHGSIGRALELVRKGEDGIREQLLDFLAQQRATSYGALTSFVKGITAQVDQAKKNSEEGVRDHLAAGMGDDLTAAQKQAMEKEVDGVICMRQQMEAQYLLDIILTWYRDLHLLYNHGDRSLMIHQDYRDQMERILLQGEPMPLERVQRAVADARLSLARSTGFALCLENLFLKLNLL